MARKPLCLLSVGGNPRTPRVAPFEGGRVTLSTVLASLLGLEEIGEGGLRAEAAIEAAAFFHDLARVRGLPAYRGRLVRPSPVSAGGLANMLVDASDAFRSALPIGHVDEDLLEGQAETCARLAALIVAAMEAPHPADYGVLVQIDLDELGQGEIVLVPISDEERAAAVRFRRARRSSRSRRKGR